MKPFWQSLLIGPILSINAQAEIIKTPHLPGWEQTPLEQIERQMRRYPNIFIGATQTDQKIAALTFDDGPSPQTLELLTLLKHHNIRATFFWLGEKIERHPEIARQALADGHTLANHTYSHARSAQMDNQDFWTNEVERTQQLFQHHLGITPRLYRPPYGDIKDSQVELLGSKEMVIAGWTINTDDWLHNTRKHGEHVIVETAKRHLHPGAIFMFHDGGGDREKTIKAIKELVPHLKHQGYQLLTIDKMFNIPAYQPDPAKALSQTMHSL